MHYIPTGITCDFMVIFLKCKRCGRSLHDPNSQALGYGPTCYKKVQEEDHIQTDLFEFEVTQ